MSQCIQPDALMKLIVSTIESAINQYILCGALQGGLKACGEDALLPRDTEIVLCRQLASLVQDGLDTGAIVAPTVTGIRTDETVLVLELATGDTLEVDLATSIKHVVSKAFVDCNGQAIVFGAAIATCTDLKILEQQYDNYYALLKQSMDDFRLWQQESLAQLGENISEQVNTKTAEWANSILKELIDLVHELHTVFHDDSLIGDGHEPAPLRVNPEWLAEQIEIILEDKIPDLVEQVTANIALVGCDGDKMPLETPIVTCAEFENFKSEVASAIENAEVDLVDCSGEKLTKGTAVATCEDLESYKKEVDDKLASVEVDLVDCDGAKIEQGSSIVTCEAFENYVSEQEAEWNDQRNINKNLAIQLEEHDDRLEVIEGDIENIKNKLDLYALAIPLDMTLKSMRGSLNVGVEILGYGFTVNHLAIDKDATVEIIDTNPREEADPTVVGYIWAEMNQAKGITVPIYNCENEIIGWASGAPFLSKNLVEIKA